MTQEECSIDLNDVSVCIAIPCYSGVLPVDTAVALADTKALLPNYGVTCAIMSERGSGLITDVRNQLLTRFLDTGMDYIFWLDDDIIFQPDDFLEVLSFATLNKNTAATYPTRSDNPKFYISLINNEYKFDQYGLLKSKGLGLGFSCIHRSLIEDLIKTKDSYKTKDGRVIHDVFRIGSKNGEYFGEDINFFQDLYDLGYPTMIHHKIHLKHVGRKDYNARLALQQKEN